jgi:hypothetical protein
MTARNDPKPVPVPGLPPRAPLSTPLVWAGGGVLLTATMWLGSMVALFRAVGSLFR